MQRHLLLLTVNAKKGMRKKETYFYPFTVGTPTTAAQPPFQPQYVSDFVFFANISAFHAVCCESTFWRTSSCMRRVCVYIHDVHVCNLNISVFVSHACQIAVSLHVRVRRANFAVFFPFIIRLHAIYIYKKKKAHPHEIHTTIDFQL